MKFRGPRLFVDGELFTYELESGKIRNNGRKKAKELARSQVQEYTGSNAEMESEAGDQMSEVNSDIRSGSLTHDQTISQAEGKKPGVSGATSKRGLEEIISPEDRHRQDRRNVTRDPPNRGLGREPPRRSLGNRRRSPFSFEE